jgi:hypothetical protein
VLGELIAVDVLTELEIARQIRELVPAGSSS